MSALSETITVEQLAFILKCRDHIMKIGAVVQVRDDDKSDPITVYYLSQDQVESSLHKWWKTRYRPRILQHCMDFAVARPAIHLEATKRYVSMNDILVVSMMEFSVDMLTQMHELLQISRFVPRMTQRPFVQFIRSMIPTATDMDCDRFYRDAVSKIGTMERRDISQKAFRTIFRAGSILYIDGPEVPDLRLIELLVAVADEWNKREGSLVGIRKYFNELSQQQPEYIKLRMYVQDVIRYETMLVHSLTIRNPLEAFVNYFQLLFSLDLLFSLVPPFDVGLSEASLISLECCVKEYWMDMVFDGEKFE
jgi:hypothetical protein